jgi:hypothetical protein
LRVVARLAHRHLKTISSPLAERRRRYSPLSGRESHVRAGRIAEDLKVLVHAADDSGTRAQSYCDTQCTDHFYKHCGNVVGQVCLATLKQARRALALIAPDLASMFPGSFQFHRLLLPRSLTAIPVPQKLPQCLRTPSWFTQEFYRCPGPAPLIVTCHFSLLTYHSLIGAVSSVVERLVYTHGWRMLSLSSHFISPM